MSPPQAYYQTPGHVIAAGAVLIVVDVVSVVMRFWARNRQKQGLRADDWLIIPATLLVVGIGSVMFYGVSQQALAHTLDIPADYAGGDMLGLVTAQTAATMRVQFAFTLMLPLALGCVKLSILFFYFRIFSTTTASKTHVFLTAVILLVALWTAAFFLATLFQCRLDLWAFFGSPADLDSHCPGTMFVDLSLCITNVVTDVVIFCIPAPLVWRLKLSTANKLTASAVFLLGSVTVIASLLRLVMTIQMVYLGFDPEADQILVITEYLYWGMVEAGTGILAACAPVFQVLFRKLPWASVLRSVKIMVRLGGSGSGKTSSPSFGSSSAANGNGNTNAHHYAKAASQQPILLKHTATVTVSHRGNNSNNKYYCQPQQAAVAGHWGASSDYSASVGSAYSGKPFPLELQAAAAPHVGSRRPLEDV
ncbi:hypothetical protein B0T26DRAFT_853581 [Lasiosphaeria miniovina]|uniref:Rhodopsin domain-containing protein n=1 Tax=Lasiosphaeria miniovina TaxID=1954250 RepID=A0AA40AJI9_9PEZI|nr:uncharacterized protein B0T26DRAFT_853581 [Lasiosphaeria miniovina]KAK0716925.1 hypothetical protein B0T26DRAFT_853581 [Lasiosphaeria miniovina]